jgi:hypothetical protein
MSNRFCNSLLLIVYFVACHARGERGKEHAERYWSAVDCMSRVLGTDRILALNGANAGKIGPAVGDPLR